MVSIKIYIYENKEQEEIINKLSKQPEEVEIVKEEEEEQDRARWLYNNWYEIIWYSIDELKYIYWVKKFKSNKK